MSATVNRRSEIRDTELPSTDDGAGAEGQNECQRRLAHGTQEMERLRIEEAESALDIVDIVHDLKSPLTTIALEMVHLDETLESNGQAELRKSVRRINNNVDFLDRMVQDLLDCCAITEGELVLQRGKTDLRALLEHVVDRAVASCDRARVVLEARAPMIVKIDALRIERVVVNLISNALKYAPRHSEILVRLEALPGFARISVTDSGPGLSVEEMGNVFGKYRRLTSKGTHEGSGLGLHVSKKIVEAHGGTIDVESVPGLGSRFYFDLPTA